MKQQCQIQGRYRHTLKKRPSIDFAAEQTVDQLVRSAEAVQPMIKRKIWFGSKRGPPLETHISLWDSCSSSRRRLQYFFHKSYLAPLILSYHSLGGVRIHLTERSIPCSAGKFLHRHFLPCTIGTVLVSLFSLKLSLLFPTVLSCYIHMHTHTYQP